MAKLGKVPVGVTWDVRVYQEEGDGVEGGKYEWAKLKAEDVFKGRRVLVFSLPGAFTPTCSTWQLPGFEESAPEFKENGIEDIYVISVNDSFVMNAWKRHNDLQHVKVIPDGNGQFTREMNMLCDKSNITFGMRSWRYAMIVNDGLIEEMWIEKNTQGECVAEDFCPSDPYEYTTPENLLAYVKGEESIGRLSQA